MSEKIEHDSEEARQKKVDELFEKLRTAINPHLVSTEQACRIRSNVAAYIQHVEEDIREQVASLPAEVFSSQTSSRSTGLSITSKIPHPTSRTGSSHTYPVKDDQRHGKPQITIPEGIVGVRRAYLEAVRDNLLAKRQYDSLVAEMTTSQVSIPGQIPTTNSAKHDNRILNNGNHIQSAKRAAFRKAYLSTLRRQDQNTQLQILTHYAQELDGLGRREGVLENGMRRLGLSENGISQALYGTTAVGNELEQATDIERRQHQQQLDGVLEQAKILTRNLEKAVIQAQYQVKREQALLEEVKQQGVDPQSATTGAKIHALQATRAELTTWIEENLARCAEAEEESNARRETVISGSQHGEREHSNGATLDISRQKITERDIQDQYDKYVQVRKRLVEAVAAMQHQVNVSKQQIILPLSQTVPSRHQDHRNIDTDTISEPPHPKSSGNLPILETQILPLINQKKTLTQYHDLIQRQLLSSRADKLALLERTSHESQLLQAFPLLARSGRFQHATAAFGVKDGARKEGEKDGDEINQHIEAWEFAARAAEDTVSETVEKAVKTGKEALEKVHENLKALKTLKDITGDP